MFCFQTIAEKWAGGFGTSLFLDLDSSTQLFLCKLYMLTLYAFCMFNLFYFSVSFPFSTLVSSHQSDL